MGTLSDNLTELAIAAFSVIGGAFGTKLLTYYLEKRELKNKKTYLNNLENISTVYTCMEETVNNTSVNKFVMLRGSNGGGMPKPGSEYYVSQVHQANKSLRSQTENYKDLTVDINYINVLTELLLKNKVVIETSKLESGLLKSILEAEKLKYVEMYYIHTKDNVLYFCFVGTTKDTGRFDSPEDRSAIELAISKIRTTFKKY